jgi:transposase-like protein
MPWRCPACHLAIRHSESEEKPRAGERYRCHICRLELVLDQETNKLTVAPMSSDDALKKRRRR